MARALRIHSNPLTSPLKARPVVGGEVSGAVPVLEQRANLTDTHKFVNFVPRNIAPLTQIIVPKDSGLNPNATLTPLVGYRIRYKGKIIDRALRSNTFKFRTGHTRANNKNAYHYHESYTVGSPYGAVGIQVYYQYNLDDYFHDTSIWSPVSDDVDGSSVDEHEIRTLVDETLADLETIQSNTRNHERDSKQRAALSEAERESGQKRLLSNFDHFRGGGTRYSQGNRSWDRRSGYGQKRKDDFHAEYTDDSDDGYDVRMRGEKGFGHWDDIMADEDGDSPYFDGYD